MEIADHTNPRLVLIEGFELRDPGGARVDLTVSVQRVLAFLALHDRPLLRVHIASCLWLDSPERRAVANLRTVLWRLRRPGCELVETTTTHLALAPAVAVDVRQQRAVIGRLLERDASPPSEDIERLADGGELLPDWYDDWVLMERERFRQVRLHALEDACQRLTDDGRYADAARAGLAAVAGEPLRESGHRALIRLHLVEGNAGEALRQYDLYAGILWRELGLRPSPLIEELVRPLRAA